MAQNIDETQSILIERGSYITRCGFQGEEEPLSTFRTPSKSIEAQFKNIFEGIMKVDPAQHRVVIVKDANTPQEVLREEAEILFLKFNVKACAFVNAQTGILFSWVNKDSNALIVDIGYESTLIVPIIEYMPQKDFMVEIPIAGKYIEKFIVEYLIQNDFSKDLIEDYNDQLFPHLMKDYFYFEAESEHDFEREAIEHRKKVLPKYLTIIDKEGKSIDVSLPSRVLPSNIIIDKCPSCNISFSEEIINHIMKILETLGMENLGSIRKYDSDPDTNFWEGRIIITGGASKILGLRSLLIRELLKTTELKRYTGCNRAPSNPLVDVEFRDIAFTIRNVPPEYKYSAWLGASIISSLKLFTNVFVSRETYQNNPDIVFQLESNDMWKPLLD